MGECPLMLSELIGKAMHLILAYGDMPVVLDGDKPSVLDCVGSVGDASAPSILAGKDLFLIYKTGRVL